VLNNLSIETLIQTINAPNSGEIILAFVGVEIVFWSAISLILIQIMPKKLRLYRNEIFIFFVVINVGLLLAGTLLTLVMILFGLAWATHRVSRPSYEQIHFQEQVSHFPMIQSKFHEGILALESHAVAHISSDEKIKSLKILYESRAQGNIGRVKEFLSDSSDETRLYAFALISSFEKELNQQIKRLQEKLSYTKNEAKIEQYRFELAQTYWQFIFHGVADRHLTGFYAQKIEQLLHATKQNKAAFILLGKIKIFNHEYDQAEEYFHKAINLGIPQKTLSTFLAEIKYGQKRYDAISEYILEEEFNIDLRLKPLISVWRAS
jgi:tetratricopeptide (TPR) repeat protein